MKKALIVLSLCTAVFFMHGCTEGSPPQINCAYEGDASIVYNSMEYEGHISYVNANTASVSLNTGTGMYIATLPFLFFYIIIQPYT